MYIYTTREVEIVSTSISYYTILHMMTLRINEYFKLQRSFHIDVNEYTSHHLIPMSFNNRVQLRIRILNSFRNEETSKICSLSARRRKNIVKMPTSLIFSTRKIVRWERSSFQWISRKNFTFILFPCLVYAHLFFNKWGQLKFSSRKRFVTGYYQYHYGNGITIT